MYSGFYAAASGMLMQQQIINVLGNNIVNQKTPGYQAERVVSTTFDYEYTIRKGAYGSSPLGSTSPARIVSEVPTNFATNYMEQTDRSTDIALDGPGFFNVLQTNVAEGEEPVTYLTRYGNFALDQDGYLVLEGVGRVQGVDGDIQVQSSDFAVSTEGIVYNSDGEAIAEILVTAPQADQIKRSRNGLYIVDDIQNNLPVTTNTQVVQGSLTASNIDVQREMTQVMEAQRALQACSNAVKTLYQMEQKSASYLAKI